MTQTTSITLAPGITGTNERTQLNLILAELNTLAKGAARPATVDIGKMWIDDSGGDTAWLIKIYTGIGDITVGTLNKTAGTFSPAGQLATFASANQNKTGTFTADASYYANIVTCDATSASLVANISAGSGLISGWYSIFQKTDSTANTVTIDPASTNLINGATTYVLKYQWQSIIVIKKTDTSFVAIPIGDFNILQSLAFLNPDESTITNDGAGHIAIKADAPLPGNPTTTTQAGSNNTTRIATTAQVQAAIQQSGKNSQGNKTVSASAPSGTPADGDIWIQYL